MVSLDRLLFGSYHGSMVNMFVRVTVGVGGMDGMVLYEIWVWVNMRLGMLFCMGYMCMWMCVCMRMSWLCDVWFSFLFLGGVV